MRIHAKKICVNWDLLKASKQFIYPEDQVTCLYRGNEYGNAGCPDLGTQDETEGDFDSIGTVHFIQYFFRSIVTFAPC